MMLRFDRAFLAVEGLGVDGLGALDMRDELPFSVI